MGRSVIEKRKPQVEGNLAVDKEPTLQGQLNELREQLNTVIARLDALVRLEVKHENTVETLRRAHDRVDKVESRLQDVENHVARNTWVSTIAAKIGYAIAAGAVSYIYFTMK